MLRSGGTNCEDETARALELGGAEADILHCDRVLEDPARLDPYQILVFAGGFSYGDDLSAGRVWGLELRSRLREKLGTHVERGGLILGVCNGFQVLVESGIFEPDKTPEERSIALYANASNHYECRWVEIESQECRCPWLTAGERMPTPVAHAEGRFVVRDEGALEDLRAGGQIALTYVGEGYPSNPNGAVADIAGICDPTGQVLGLMPPPRAQPRPLEPPGVDQPRQAQRGRGPGVLPAHGRGRGRGPAGGLSSPAYVGVDF